MKHTECSENVLWEPVPSFEGVRLDRREQGNGTWQVSGKEQ